MLALRFLRSGRKNSAFYRVVLTENSRPPKSGFLKILGWYNPHTKESSLNKEEILLWLNKGAIASNSVSKLLIKNKIDHKGATFIKDAPKDKKEKSDQKPAATAKKPEEKSDEIDVKDTPLDNTTEQAPAEEVATQETPDEPVKSENEVKDAPKNSPAVKVEKDQKVKEEK